MKKAKQIAVWLLVAVFVGGVVWGLVKNTTLTPSEPSALLSISSSDWVKGNSGSKIVLVEYSDFQCPACGAYHPVVKQLVDEFGNDVAFVYRHFPLRQIHPNADLSARGGGSEERKENSGRCTTFSLKIKKNGQIKRTRLIVL